MLRVTCGEADPSTPSDGMRAHRDGIDVGAKPHVVLSHRTYGESRAVASAELRAKQRGHRKLRLVSASEAVEPEPCRAEEAIAAEPVAGAGTVGAVRHRASNREAVRAVTELRATHARLSLGRS